MKCLFVVSGVRYEEQGLAKIVNKMCFEAVMEKVAKENN